MLTPQDFEKYSLTDLQRFALWFHDMVQEAIQAYNNNDDRKYTILVDDQAIKFNNNDIMPNELRQVLIRDSISISHMLKQFGWIVTTMYLRDHDENPFLFIWTDENIETPKLKAKLEKEYKYVTFNNVMWQFGHVNIVAFDEWFEKIADERQNKLSHYELIHKCLVISYKDIKYENSSFVESKRKQVSNNHVVTVSTLKKPYVEHLKILGWRIKDEFVNNDYSLICSWGQDDGLYKLA